MFLLKVVYKKIRRIVVNVIVVSVLLLLSSNAWAQHTNKVKALKDTLLLLEKQADHEILRLNFSSLYQVIQSKKELSKNDSILLGDLYDIISDATNPYKLTDLSTYTGRHRSLIVSWISQTDNEISFALLRLPKNWKMDNAYAMYIYLHGLWDIAGNKIHYALLSSLMPGAVEEPLAFQDGYLIEPWGRGNLWYRGIAETDVWECIARINELFEINAQRRYIAGFSMGGSGAWYIGGRSANYWAAVGIQSGVVVYEEGLSEKYIAGLSDIPVFFISGKEDDLTQWLEAGFHLLRAAGNKNTEIEIVEGGHDWTQENTNRLYLWLQNYENSGTATDKDSVSNSMAQVFPNPTSDIIYIGGYGEILDGRFTIHNINGQLVKKDHCRGRVIDLSDLSSGTYVVQIVYGENVLHTKIIKSSR